MSNRKKHEHITDQQALEICYLLGKEYTYPELADRFSIAESTVSNIVCGNSHAKATKLERSKRNSEKIKMGLIRFGKNRHGYFAFPSNTKKKDVAMKDVKKEQNKLAETERCSS